MSVMAMGGSLLYGLFNVEYRVEFSYNNVYEMLRDIMIGSIIISILSPGTYIFGDVLW
jgi:hypothetical protein